MCFFFFQAEDGIRYLTVTGVQTCALPIFYFATVLARVFYGGGSGSLLLTLGGFAIAYLMRPLGAVAFSHIGDKYGRRRMMLMSVALMTAAMLATALLPTRAAIGPTAGGGLLLLRRGVGGSVGGG